jgi:hypothetical protein
MEFLIHIK